MKRFSVPLWFGLLAGVVGTSQSFAVAERNVGRYELYSWKDGNEWLYSIVPATAKDKAAVEIKTSGGPLRGASKVKEKLLGFDDGDAIAWKQRAESGLELPPADQIEEIQAYAQTVGVKVIVPPSATKKSN